MTKQQFDEKTLEEVIDWASENIPNEITIEESLLEFAKMKIDDNIPMAIHILQAVYDSDEAFCGYYLYDYNMGMLETPTPITSKEDFEHLIDFNEDDD